MTTTARHLPAGATAPRPQQAFPLTILGIWNAFWSQPWSFKWTCLYIFFEYVRPQQVYPVLQFAPWALLTICAASLALVLEARRIRLDTPAIPHLVVMSLVILASSLLAYSPTQSFDKIDVWVNWLVAFVLITHTVLDRRRFYLFVVLFLLWSTKMSQHGLRAFLLTGGGASGAPGWFQNTGEFALQMCIYVPLSFYLLVAFYPRLSKVKVALLALLPIAGVASVLGSGSRGGQLALACVAGYMLLRSRHKIRGFVAVAILVPIVWTALPADQKERFSTAGSDKTSVSRLAYWKAGLQMANEHPVFGVGFENWALYYQTYFPPSKGGIVEYGPNGEVRVEVSHNSFVEVVSQLGYAGLLAFCAAIFAVFRTNALTRRALKATSNPDQFLFQMTYALDAGLIGFLVAGFFMAVAFYPFVWIHLAIAVALKQVVSSPATRPVGVRRRPDRSKTVRARHVVAGVSP